MKYRIAVLFGGCSPEHEVSLQSAQAVLEHLDTALFDPVPVAIDRAGRWSLYNGPLSAIGDGSWQQHPHVPALISPDRETHGLLVIRPYGVETIPLDAALPVLHGENGEDGTVQGLLELAGIPVVGCGSLASALAMDKDRAHRLAALAGVAVPRGRVVPAGTGAEEALGLTAELGLPLFVKPLRAGSSFGVSRVERREDVAAALALAGQYGEEILLEEAIPGAEVGVAVLGSRELTLGRVDMIRLAGGFFDFTEKYNLITSEILVPAPISPEKEEEIKEAAVKVYRALDCRGFARVDLFLTPGGSVIFNEVNTIPGFTAHSRFPGMLMAAGLTFTEIVTRAIRLALEP